MQHYVVMTSLLRPFDAANDAVTPTFSDVVLASDAEAAVAAAEAAGYHDCVMEHGIGIVDRDFYEQGQRDALAAAVQRVEALPLTTRLAYNRSEVLAVLRALGGDDE